MEKKLILVLGGARSGKSAFAENLAKQISDKVLYVATAAIGDEEMRRRVEQHRLRRPASWRILETTIGVGNALASSAADEEAILLDCLALLVSNVLLQHSTEDEESSQQAFPEIESAVRREIDELVEAYRRSKATFIVVSNEVGLGLVPPYPLGRAYRDLLGIANQKVATHADEVYLLFAGVPVELKALSKALVVPQAGEHHGDTETRSPQRSSMPSKSNTETKWPILSPVTRHPKP
ncbi:MAG: bifunctional adenosylcobinamide kinase/adenosylcobinamide-phosphate guanylyltransferase [Chloroflexi bacterium]|nr:bifunctional adenosylcobinamide kinase/adenosylcobinamide-phosphate guanylyltransferase [Chloroflexota bacterium]MDA8187326.1 bifunctional adenosylcobinamide kinase/adenosylcobinamide-phosphate guanylyltransferase [Dehalococcoidales bacterium]